MRRGESTLRYADWVAKDRKVAAERAVPEEDVAAADAAEALTAPIRDLLSADNSKRVPYKTILAAVWITIGSLAAVTLVVLVGLALHKVFFWLIMATFLAMVLNPAVKRVEGWGLPRGVAILSVVLVTLIVTFGVGAAIAVPLAGSAGDINISDLQTGKGPLGHLVVRFHLQDEVERIEPALQKLLDEAPRKIVEVINTVASAALSTTLVIILAIFLLAEGPNIVRGVMSIVPEHREESFSRVGEATSAMVSGYTTGVFLLAGMNGAVAAIALASTGVSFVGPLAVWAGLIDVLPIIGGILAIVPAALLAFAHSTVAGIVVVSAMLLYQQIKNHFLYPVVIGKAVKLNALLVLIAVLVGTELFQVTGAVLAIPVAGTIQAVISEVVNVYKGRPDIHEDSGAGEAIKGAKEALSTRGRVRSLFKIKGKAAD